MSNKDEEIEFSYEFGYRVSRPASPIVIKSNSKIYEIQPTNTKEVSDLETELFQYENFCFGELFLPKVTVYLSSLFKFESKVLGVCISELNPRVETLSIDEETELKTFVPWTHMVSFVDLNNKVITHSFLFFSRSRMTSEDFHTFFIPKAESSCLEVSPILGSFGITDPVFECVETPVPFNDLSFGKEIRKIRKEGIQKLLANLNIDVTVTDDADSFVENVDSWFDTTKTVEMSSVHSFFANANELSTPSFSDRLKKILETKGKDNESSH